MILILILEPYNDPNLEETDFNNDLNNTHLNN